MPQSKWGLFHTKIQIHAEEAEILRPDYFIAAIKLVNKQTQLNSAAPATAWIFFTPAKTKMNLFEHIKKGRTLTFFGS